MEIDFLRLASWVGMAQAKIRTLNISQPLYVGLAMGV